MITLPRIRITDYDDPVTSSVRTDPDTRVTPPEPPVLTTESAPRCPSSAGRAGRRGLLAAGIGALPLIGPWLVSSFAAACAGCLGVGAAATGAAAASAGGGASRAAGFGAWWLMVSMLALVLLGQAARARRRRVPTARIITTAALTLVFSGAVYAGTVVAFGHAQPARATVPSGQTLP